MNLTDISLDGLGEFEDAKAGFIIRKYHLEEPWGYIFTTERLLLRVDQRGPDYAQFTPPGGTILFRRERYQTCPSIFVWVKTGPGRAFTNFYHPVIGFDPTREPEDYCCEFVPERALYTVTMDSIRCETELFVPIDKAVMVMTCRVANTSSQPREIELCPVMRPHMAAASLEVWDMPWLYQTVAYSNDKRPLFFLEMRSPNAEPLERERTFVITDLDSPDGAEVDYARFIGGGSFENPSTLYGGKPGVDASARHGYLAHSVANAVDARQGIAALSKKLVLKAGESLEFNMVTGKPGIDDPTRRPAFDEIEACCDLLTPDGRKRALSAARESYERFAGVRAISTPDKAFDRYVNEWLPLQLRWVGFLDRGWPSGMRGVRDCSEDTAAFPPLDPAYARRVLLTEFGMQRSDGWFPRQFSVHGKRGKHDLRLYVDGGNWVWALLDEYLRWTKDFAILDEPVDWLDSDDLDSVFDHLARAIDWYLAPENLGEHGICKMWEGDWNDGNYRSGVEGRGETVLGTCQLIITLKQAAEMVEHLDLGGDGALSVRWRERAEELKADLLRHALNSEGYLNGCFTDNGEWAYSNKDPDGRRRVNIPANAYGMLSGVLIGRTFDSALAAMMSVKLRDGWPLYYPAVNDPPIEKLGRAGRGDLVPGVVENGAIYNHGSHGFFGRGIAGSGHGDLLYDLLRYLMPYDQERHPVARAKTAPYGVPNHWKTAPGVEGRGGTCFLSGSISAGIRNVYNGMFGINPTYDALTIYPDLPSKWDRCRVRFAYLGSEMNVTYCRRDCSLGEAQPSACLRVFFDGREITDTRLDVLRGRVLPAIPDIEFAEGGSHEIVVEL